MVNHEFSNPFRPGAGHQPPYLAGRKQEQQEFLHLLKQDVILENMVLTGLRGVGKTVLLETFKPMAIKQRWAWVGTDLSETASVSEENISLRLLTDLAPVTSNIVFTDQLEELRGFTLDTVQVEKRLDFQALCKIYQDTPGLPSDKLRTVLEVVWKAMEGRNVRGMIFAYDEAQNLSDQANKEEFPLSLLLDVFQSIQRKNIPFMLVLTGLPTLFPKLVEARTYSERMFHVVFLDRLTPDESREAIKKPIEVVSCPVRLTDESVDLIVDQAGGYPYFIQFICREVYDVFLQEFDAGMKGPKVPIGEIIGKLDADFFAGRWARATDRQRELLMVIATLETCDQEFTVQEVVDQSRSLIEKPFSSSHVSQMLLSIGGAGLIYKNRHGKYSFAVPLFWKFIFRQFPDLTPAPLGDQGD